MIRLNDAQHRRVKKLTRCHCANNVRGCCLLLDDGEPCVCVQAISYSLLCRWFTAAVLPLDEALEAALLPILPGGGAARRPGAMRRSCSHGGHPQEMRAVRQALSRPQQPCKIL